MPDFSVKAGVSINIDSSAQSIVNLSCRADDGGNFANPTCEDYPERDTPGPDREREPCNFASVFVKLTMPREHHNSVQAHLPSGLVRESVSRIPVDVTAGPRNQHSLGHRVLRNDLDYSVVLDPAPGRQILDGKDEPLAGLK